MRLSESLDIDGVLDEAVWQEAPVVGDFTQREPVDQGTPTEETVVRVLYDDEAIYIGAMLYDASPDSIVARLGRRDADLDADKFSVNIDPYYDRRTGFYFDVNAAGTMEDGILYNDDWNDNSWDGIWQGKARIQDDGWVVEMRIPYSQLRFKEKDVYVWGINFKRYIARKNELDYLVAVPRDEAGFVSHFADMTGIEQITPPRQIEMTPYVTAKAAFTDHEDGDPFNDGSSYTPNAGADFKIGLTSNLTLNGTVNPDFGQVEVDPAVVNISDVETFFPEKRPFFIEGSSIFNFGFGGSNNFWGFNFGNPEFFYTRRVGRSPQGSLPDNDYADRPDGTSILGAAKLTGKLGNGWNVGTVQVLTSRESADVRFEGETFEAEVEPLAYYGIVRAQREFQEGRQALGFISTTAARRFADDRLKDEINSGSQVVGLDGWTFLDRDRTWVVTGWLGASQIRGTEQQIINVQRNAQHYFQRPDASHVAVDSSATSLSGLGGRVMLNKQRGRFYTNAAIGFVSPGFDVNDLGFMSRSDVINGHLVLGYRWFEPHGIRRYMQFNTSYSQSHDFDGNLIHSMVWFNNYWEFKNYWSAFWGGNVQPERLDNRRTRGGPLTINPASGVIFVGGASDSRKPVVFETEVYRWQSASGSTELGAVLEAEWKPMANLTFSVGPNLSVNDYETQYVATIDDPTATATYGQRYVFGQFDQTTLSANLRLNWTFTPGLSFQLFAQPLISAGDFTEFKELDRPRTYDFNIYGGDVGTIAFDEENDEYVVDPDGTGEAESFTFGEPDFNFKSLRGTAVLRWEFRPGSTLYLVWTQTRDDFENVGAFRVGNDLGQLWDAKPDNIFLVKFSYWLNR